MDDTNWPMCHLVLFRKMKLIQALITLLLSLFLFSCQSLRHSEQQLLPSFAIDGTYSLPLATVTAFTPVPTPSVPLANLGLNSDIPSGIISLITTDGIYIMSPDGAVGVKRYPLSSRFGSLSPDGNQLVFQDGGAIKIYDIMTGRISNIVKEGGDAPHWAPDGKQIAYSCENIDAICVVDTNGSLLHQFAYSTERKKVGGWSHDSTKIIYTEFVTPPMGGRGKGRFHIFDITMGKIVQTIDEENLGGVQWIARPSFSPDDELILFHGKKDNLYQIFSLNLNNDELRIVTHENNNTLNPVFSPDGMYFFAITGDTEAPSLFTIEGRILLRLDINGVVTSWVTP